MAIVISEKELIISRDPERMSGVPVFAGTRVPITHLLEHIEGNDSIDEFLDGFPTVKREQVVELLRRIGELLKDAEI